MSARELVGCELSVSEDVVGHVVELSRQLAEQAGDLQEVAEDGARLMVLHSAIESVKRRAASLPDGLLKLERILALLAFHLRGQTADPAPFANAILKVQRMVAIIRKKDGSSAGTGFLIGAKHLLTAFHNVGSSNVIAEFVDGPPANLVGVVVSSPDTALDYAVYELDREAGRDTDTSGAERSWVSLSASLPSAIDGDATLLLHWPTTPLLSIGSRIVTGALTGELRYTAATFAGSSGAPCFDIHWNCIGLHLSDLGIGRAADAIHIDLGAQRFVLSPPPVSIYPPPPALLFR